MKTIIRTSFTELLFFLLLAGAYGQNKSEQTEKYLENSKDQDTPGSSYVTGGMSKIKDAEDMARKQPTDETFLYLSLVYYQEGMYKKCIVACENALELQPDYADAYNNICSAYNELSMWDKAIEACEKSLKIIPDHQLARNNLEWAKSKKALQLID